MVYSAVVAQQPKVVGNQLRDQGDAPATRGRLGRRWRRVGRQRGRGAAVRQAQLLLLPVLLARRNPLVALELGLQRYGRDTVGS